MSRLTPQPMIVVDDVEASSAWYQAVLGAESGHGGPEYEQLLVDGALVLQLHAAAEAHHHGHLSDPAVPLGNGVALWFATDAFDKAVARIRATDAEVVTDAHFNPNAQQREIWLHDPDGFLVVISEARAG